MDKPDIGMLQQVILIPKPFQVGLPRGVVFVCLPTMYEQAWPLYLGWYSVLLVLQVFFRPVHLARLACIVLTVLVVRD